MISMFRKLFLKIKRFLFIKITRLTPEDVRKLIYVQKYLERKNKNNVKTYNEYLRDNYVKSL